MYIYSWWYYWPRGLRPSYIACVLHGPLCSIDTMGSAVTLCVCVCVCVCVCARAHVSHVITYTKQQAGVHRCVWDILRTACVYLDRAFELVRRTASVLYQPLWTRSEITFHPMLPDFQNSIVWGEGVGGRFPGFAHIEYSERNLPQCHTIHHKSHMVWTGIETGPPWWDKREVFLYIQLVPRSKHTPSRL